jgi:ATP-dependent helicase/DNAse subunit B
MTKPQDALFLTLSKVDQDGKSIRPSYLIGRLKVLFSSLTVRDEEKEMQKSSEEKSYCTVKAALPQIREGINRWLAGEETGEDQALLGWMLENEEGKPWIKAALLGKFYTNEESPLSFAAAKAIYGLHMETGVTRLEAYSACAFAHFFAVRSDVGRTAKVSDPLCRLRADPPQMSGTFFQGSERKTRGISGDGGHGAGSAGGRLPAHGGGGIRLLCLSQQRQK